MMLLMRKIGNKFMKESRERMLHIKRKAKT